MTHAIALAPAACADSGERDLLPPPWRAAALLLAAMIAIGALGDRSAGGTCGGTGITTAEIAPLRPIGHA